MDDQWEAIRDLDERENWFERTAVLSKEDHLHLMQCSKEILADLVNSLPITDSNKVADDEVEHFTDEDFQYSAAQFDVDYLERISSDKSEPSELTRQSLYVKFDPLVGKVSPEVGKMETSTSGDLLMFNTPPAPGVHVKSCLTSSKKTSTTKKHVHIGKCETIQESPLISIDTPPSQKDPSSAQRTALDSSPRPYSDTETLQGLFPDSHEAPINSLSSGNVASPVTDTLVKVLKYSEEDLTKLKQGASNESKENTRKKKEEEITALKERITALKREAKKVQQKDNSVKMAMSSHHTLFTKLEAEIQQFRERNEAHEHRETDALDHCENLLKDLSLIEKRHSVIRKDMNILESIFEQVHTRYLALKTLHKKLVQQNEVLEKKKIQLQQWNKQGYAHIQSLKEEYQRKAEEIETTVGQTKKEYGAKISLEKARQNQLRMQIDSLENSIQQMEQENQQLSAMCEELMKEM